MRLLFLLFILFLSCLCNASFQKNCRTPKLKELGFLCPQCELGLQKKFSKLIANYLEIKPDAMNGVNYWGDVESGDQWKIKNGLSAEDFLADAAALFKAENVLGNHKLNFITICSSQSLHKTPPGSPRVALKSPNSEIVITFNTDSTLSSYQKVEILRWDGKNAKYRMQELDFGGAPIKGGMAHFDGIKCTICHKVPVRPNWAIYRAWPGVCPPRDDLVEGDYKKHGLIYRIRQKLRSFGSQKIDAAGREYLNFLSRIANARKNPTGPDRRLAILEIPSNYIGSDEDKIKSIEEKVLRQGYYRIPHYPATDKLGNYNTKTALMAGPSTLAFDQFQAQQSCQISNMLLKTPGWDKLKYAMTAFLFCLPHRNMRVKQVKKYLPEDFLLFGGYHFGAFQRTHNSVEDLKKAKNSQGGLTKGLELAFRDTQKVQQNEMQEKVDFQISATTNYLVEI